MSRSIRWPVVVLAAAFALAAIAASAKTPDGETPAVETACDGLTGAAYGLCTAFCEAQDCDLQDELDSSCQQLFDNFVRLTGENPPCWQVSCTGGRPLGITYDVNIQIATDDQYCLYQDGVFVDCRTDWRTTGDYHIPMESGCHVLAVEGADVFGLISAMISVVRVDGVAISLSGDGTWVHAPTEPPPLGWREVGFDDALWPPAIACTNPSPWGGAPAALIGAGAQWVWDDPAGDCFTRLGEAYFRLELTLP